MSINSHSHYVFQYCRGPEASGTLSFPKQLNRRRVPRQMGCWFYGVVILKRVRSAFLNNAFMLLSSPRALVTARNHHSTEMLTHIPSTERLGEEQGNLRSLQSTEALCWENLMQAVWARRKYRTWPWETTWHVGSPRRLACWITKKTSKKIPDRAILPKVPRSLVWSIFAHFCIMPCRWNLSGSQGI